jgi:hypothetical protein
VERDPLKAAHTERREAVFVLESAELALDGCTAPVEVAPAIRVETLIGFLSGTTGAQPRSSTVFPATLTIAGELYC